MEVVAHRTSPTNMGLALLANLSAYDFGYLSAGELIERTANALGTMQTLERHRGHFYNWYDTRSLKPLPPLYVSSVDSGNLACHLLTLRQGLLALADASILAPRCFEGLLDTAALAGDTSLRAELRVGLPLAAGDGERGALPSRAMGGASQGRAARPADRGRPRRSAAFPLSRRRGHPDGARACRAEQRIGPARARAHRGARAPGEGSRPARAHGVRLPGRQGAPASRHRLQRRRDAARRELLRPARFRGAREHLRRDRAGTAAAGELVRARPPAHHRRAASRRCCRGAARCSST